MQLLPLLTASPLPGHVVSIYAGGFEDGNKAGQLPIGCPSPSEYGVGGVRKYTAFMKAFLFEELARKNAGHLSLSHIFPGLVDGPTFYSNDMPTWFRYTWRVMKPFASVGMTSTDDCGQVMTYLLTSRYPARGTVDKENKNANDANGAGVAQSSDGVIGGGSYSLGQRGDVPAKGPTYGKIRQEGVAQKVWDHTVETLERIEKENAKVS